MKDSPDLTATEQARRIADGTLSAEDLMQATLERIAAVNGKVNAIVSMRDADALLAEAAQADEVAPAGPLHGLPLAVKDLAHAKGLPTTMGSPAFAAQVAEADDLHVARMRAAGAIIIGKTNTPEFGLGSHTYNPVHGATRNPYDLRVSCGGSSGGAAVALATGMLSIADGSDMMGSLRNPAGWNNVYGMRPSWGRVPSEPEGEAYLHQLATNGPMARAPADLALQLDVMAGPDKRVPNAMAHQAMSSLNAAAKGKRIGWLADWGGALPYEAGILDICAAAVQVFEDLGAEVEVLPAPFPREALWESWVNLRAWSNAASLAPLMGDPELKHHLKPEAIWEAEKGQALSAMQVHKASELRSDWFRAAAALFDTYDALVAPTAQVWPFPIEQTWPRAVAGQGMDTYHRWMECVVPVSLIGLPAVALPAGFGPAGLPMGIQVFGRHGEDRAMLEMAEAYHQATGWPERHPPPVI